MKFLVTGGAGFIGSHFCDRVLERGHEVLCFDNFSTGQEFFIKEALKNKNFRVERGDIRNLAEIQNASEKFKADWTVHFAANADVRFGTSRPNRDLEYNTVGTWNVLESARLAGTPRFLFSSTGSVYGEPEVFPTPENAPFPEQTSLYGASKLAGEGLISAYSHGYGMKGLVFRFVSILGPRYTHGHVFDFLAQLLKNPNELKVLGDGNQTKSYLHVSDLMNGLETAIKFVESSPTNFNIFNIGHEDALTVKQSIQYLLKRLNLNPKIEFAGGTRGWIGDSPCIRLSTDKLRKLEWASSNSLEKSVIDTIDYLMEYRSMFFGNK